MAGKLSRHCLIWLFKCSITGGILYYLFETIPARELINALVNVDTGYILLALFTFFIPHYIKAIQLNIFTRLQGMSFTTLELLKISFVTQFYGLLLPGELSTGLVKWHKLSRENKMRAQAVACIVLTRAMHTLSLAILGVTFFLIEMPYNSAPVLISLVLGLIMAILLYLSITHAPLANALKNTINTLRPIKLPETIRKKIANIWHSLEQFHTINPLKLNYALFLSFVSHLAGIIPIYFIMLALKINVPITSIIWIRAAVTFLQLLPISISGLGVREGAFVFLLKTYNIPAPDAMALSLIIFSMVVLMALIGGALEAGEFLFKKKNN